ncbi:MAG: MFS transporter [Proteobacteria bacterium]|nr:MFS transporter [Pseudomonadota bacterium]
MSKKQHLTAPVATEDLPKGIPYIIGNEAAERFSFYGMKGILTVFMTQYLHLLSDNPNHPVMDKADAIARYHDFTSWVYLTPLFGALIADWLLGKYKTILSLSIVYCLGHLALAFMGAGGMTPEAWMLSGLALIAIGSGGIKPCVSAHVGDQFGQSNKHWLTQVFGWFYISINVGAFASTLLTPWLLEWYGPHWAFGVPGVLMAVATVLFWMGRNVFIHIPPKGPSFWKETFSKEGLLALAKLFIIFLFVAVFWALFDQTGSSWVLQAEDMDRNFLGRKWLSSQIQAVNPIMIVILVPLFNYVLYPMINRVVTLTPLRKISIGLFIMVIGFGMVALLQEQIDQGARPNIGWQLLAYAVLTSSEILVSITCLEFAYTQAPLSMKSVIMAVNMLSVSLGNYFTAGVNHFIQIPNSLKPAYTLNDHLQTPDQNGDKPILSQDETQSLLSEHTDLYGTPMLLNKNSNGYTIILAGPDKNHNSEDDVQLNFNSDGSLQNILISEQKSLEQGFDQIKTYFDANEERLPQNEKAAELLSETKDNWNNPIKYRMINQNTFRLASNGPDQKYMTQDDLVLITSIFRPSLNEEDQNTPYTWRERRIIELKGAEGEQEVIKLRGGIEEISFDSSTMVGGQTSLEGADYFWFFTQTMLGTAFLFVGVALLYKPKEYLQEEASEAEETINT